MKKLFVIFAVIAVIMCSCVESKSPLKEPETILLDEPKEIECAECYTVYKTVDETHGLAKSDFVEPERVLVETEDVCYDGLECCATDWTTFVMVGIYRYDIGLAGIATVPIVKLVRNFEENEE